MSHHSTLASIAATNKAPQLSAKAWTHDESLFYLISQVRTRLVAAMDAELAPLSITWAQWVPLVHIANGSADTAAALSRNTACDTGSTTRMLDRLAVKGLIRRERSADDRRVVRLYLTKAGEALYPQLPHASAKALSHHLRGFTREELETFKSFLRRMLANIDRP